MSYFYLGIPITLLILISILLLVFHFRKKSVIQKVKCMPVEAKKQVLDTLAEPAGYLYEPCQDIFTSRLDAPQKMFGYTSFYDFSAAYFNMVFDYETIYFDYRQKTWRIEMWKGQYGINTGCELGVYYADGIVPPDKYKTAIFHAVNPCDMPKISLKLNRRCTSKTNLKHHKKSTASSAQYHQLGHMRGHHWWLTIFRMGCFSKPTELFVNTSIQFPNQRMMYCFLESFRETLPHTEYKTGGSTVYFTFDKSSRRYRFFKRIVRQTALFFCRFYCMWFRTLTRPFQKSGDKLLYAYYYLPFIVRRMFRKPKKR